MKISQHNGLQKPGGLLQKANQKAKALEQATATKQAATVMIGLKITAQVKDQADHQMAGRVRQPRKPGARKGNKFSLETIWQSSHKNH